MARTGSLYGLGVRTDVPVAALEGTARPAAIDVEWILGRMPEGFDRIPPQAWRRWGAATEPGEEAPVRVFHAPAQGLFRFDYADATRVAIDRGGTNVWATWAANATVEDTATYLLGPVMGFVLRLRGVPCLHASAAGAGAGGRAIAFAGHAGSGKSTLAAALGLRGHPVLTEDVLALRWEDGVPRAAPGYPLVRLWPASSAAMFGAAEALPRITPTWDKRFLALGGPGVAFASEAMELQAVCVLDDRGGSGGLVRLAPSEALVWLVAHAYSTHILDRAMRAAEFERLSRLAAQVPVFRVSPPAEFDRLAAFLDALLARVAGTEHAPV